MNKDTWIIINQCLQLHTNRDVRAAVDRTEVSFVYAGFQKVEVLSTWRTQRHWLILLRLQMDSK